MNTFCSHKYSQGVTVTHYSEFLNSNSYFCLAVIERSLTLFFNIVSEVLSLLLSFGRSSAEHWVLHQASTLDTTLSPGRRNG